MKRLMVLGMAAMSAASVWAVTGTVTTDSDTFTGEITWQARAKQYTISVKSGKTMLDREVKLGDVVSLDVAKPAGFDKAVSQVDAGQGAAAVPVLAKIVSEYKMLKWDKIAGRYLALAYIAAGNAQKAYDACQPIIAEDKTAAYSGDLAAAYWQALLKLGKREELEKNLKKASSSGSRGASAAALIMRGDIIVAASNDNPDQLKDALRDGYLRVVLMYKDPECARENAEACLKAAGVFDKLGQGARAERLRAQAKGM